MDLSGAAEGVEEGRAVRDTTLHRIGVVTAIEGEAVRLRELRTGALWQAPISHVERLTARSELSLRVALANDQGMWARFRRKG